MPLKQISKKVIPLRKTNVEINGKNYYRSTATIGKSPDGSPIRKQFYGSSKKEAEQKRDEYLSSINKGLSANFDKAIFRHVFKTWFDNVLKPTISLSSYNRYEIEYKKRIQDCVLSDMKLTDIKPINVQGFYNELLQTNSVKTVRYTHRLLISFFSYCVKADLIIKNPLLAVELPRDKTKRDNNNVLCRADIDKMIEVSQRNIENFIYVFAIFTGLRQGEILALTHNDIDLEHNTINVNKSIKYLMIDGEYKAVLSPTKTVSSIREVPILSAIQAQLNAYIRYEKEKHLRLGIPFTGESILFSSSSCTYKEAANLRKGLLRLYKRLDIKETTFHGLRHTFCTILAEMGVPLKTASILMGHSNINITAEIYTHVDNKELKKGIEKLAAFFEN